MPLHLVVFIAGTILVCASALGGGLKIKEIEVPKIEPISRALSLIVGACLIVLGVYLHDHERDIEISKVREEEQKTCARSIDNQIADLKKRLTEEFSAEKEALTQKSEFLIQEAKNQCSIPTGKDPDDKNLCFYRDKYGRRYTDKCPT